MPSIDVIDQFVRTIWDWYDRHKRVLPWRDLTDTDDTQRAYQVLVSEIMLQQTQVPRVIAKYKEWLELFPDIVALAAATDGAVIVAWRGLGYNNRALRLRNCAAAVVHDHSGVFPQDMSVLESLPGVGHYTAAAVRNFAFNIPTPCLDTNIRRILHRSFFGAEAADGSWEHSDTELLALAADLLQAAIGVPGPHHDAANWHAALMDYGSLVCTKNNPKWDICPLTAAGLMKAAYKTPTRQEQQQHRQQKLRREPGREVAGRYIPNRIFRGRIVETLREHAAPLLPEQIGSEVCIDWSAELQPWLHTLLEALQRDRMIVPAGSGRFRLPD